MNVTEQFLEKEQYSNYGCYYYALYDVIEWGLIIGGYEEKYKTSYKFKFIH